MAYIANRGIRQWLCYRNFVFCGTNYPRDDSMTILIIYCNYYLCIYCEIWLANWWFFQGDCYSPPQLIRLVRLLYFSSVFIVYVLFRSYSRHINLSVLVRWL